MVPHLSTELAQRCLVSQIGRDATRSPRYERMMTSYRLDPPGRGAPPGTHQKSSSSGNRTPGVCVTGRNVTNYTNEDYSSDRHPAHSTRTEIRTAAQPGQNEGTTGIEPVTCGSAIRCSTAELSTHTQMPWSAALRFTSPGHWREPKITPPPGLEPGTYRLTAERSAN